ncbi:MAG TPA: hypothetical protein VHE34_03835 [Puia sp.]|uniref:cytochrome C oxidase subunit I n=1 Tax=Puia sp. TaxID=2045100 RepID=UPI002C89CB5A|nr:cytochrome C oxidase subunit I [Puia sp.]HVU94325.1 hypothetical protein [Puia sp.]
MTADTKTKKSNTTYKVVLPFYLYAGLAFATATTLLFTSSDALRSHFFQPKLLAITHTMALGWGTMIILGASYQLLPVLTQRRLYSVKLAGLSFVLAALAIPLLVYAFYTFDLGWPAITGGSGVVLAVSCYLINVFGTVGKKENIHAVFCATAAGWLLLTTLTGLALIIDFTSPFLPKGALAYLPLHAHIGIAGWFLGLIVGVASRLIPMFLISKYTNERLLQTIFWLLNGGLLLFLLLFFGEAELAYYAFPIACLAVALALFGYYCYRCYHLRLRRRTDAPVRISLASVVMMLAPLFLLAAIITGSLAGSPDSRLVLVYGFFIFFGWITAIILGMTFKTLPFIVWNKTYHRRAAAAQPPNPKDLGSDQLFSVMILSWLAGLLIVLAGIGCRSHLLLRSGSAFLIATAFFYNLNIWKIIAHKPSDHERHHQ